ncbi:MAG: methyltransferase family protein, partial [Gemmatimonadales bacterium]
AMVLGTLLAIWSIVTFVIVGRGTPMAFDAPRLLVITGPYAWVRNPMVAGFLMQGIGVGLLTGSYVVILLYLLLGLGWDLWVRPLDEDTLQKRFGRDLERYRRHVPCWVPRSRPWSPPPPTAPISVDELPIPGRNRRAS